MADELTGTPTDGALAGRGQHAERREHLSVDDLDKRRAWRDRRLMALAAHKKKAAMDFGS